ncbi:MAG TPA: DJ-1/PfpI family protein [Haliangiales bacterium]|nr:DJ-1/PfpI family protein [Haliangiales bacterium]
MRIAIVTFDGFNEIDSFVAFNILNRMRVHGWKAEIVCPSDTVVSGNGVRVTAQRPLEFANEADVVLFGSGRLTPRIVADPSVMSRFGLDPRRQLIGCQCSGALALAKLGLLRVLPVCTDLATRPLVEAEGIRVLSQSFFAAGNIASAGGCLSSPMLAAWVIRRLADRAAAETALGYVAPVGEYDAYIAGVLDAVEPYVAAGAGHSGHAMQEST